MTELEKMQRARMYLDKMANGVDPITDQRVSDVDTLNNVRISRCLFYVSDILRQVIENGGVVGRPGRPPKQSFAVSQKELSGFALSDTPIPVSEITRRINELVADRPVTKLKHTSIASFLIESGFLTVADAGDGRSAKLPTEQGETIGISVEERQGSNGSYRVTVYDREAQQFILDHIDVIMAINARPRAEAAEKAELQGQPWSRVHDDTLADLCRKGVPVDEIAVTLKRTKTGVQARMKKLGLTEQGAAK